MANALPRNIQLKLEQTLAQWTHWQCEPALTHIPAVVAVLTPGISNHGTVARNLVDRVFATVQSAVAFEPQCRGHVIRRF